MNIPPIFAKARTIALGFRASSLPALNKTDDKLLSASKKGDEGELYIYAPIGQSWWQDGVTAQQVIDKLNDLKGSKKLSVRINSEGGEIWDAKAIANAIQRFDAKEKTTYIDGLAASAATTIALACPRVVSASNATWMIHEVSAGVVGRASDMRAMADVIDMENATCAAAYSKKTGLSLQECLALMEGETWMNAAQAKERGFSDETAEEDDAEEEKAAAVATSAGPMLQLAGSTRQLITDLHEQARIAKMEMRTSQITDSRQASLTGATRDGRPQRAVTARSGGT